MKKELVIGIVIGAGVVALVSGASASSLLYPLLLLACPLIMLFMHGGRAGHSENPEPRADTSADDSVGTKR